MRTNACWPLEEPDREVEAALDATEGWFGSRGLPPRFKLTEGATAPADLPTRLARRGYQACKRTLVLTGSTAGQPDGAVRMSDRPDSGFEAVFTASAAGNVADARERLETLARIPAPARFASLDLGGATAALGACAIEGQWAGLFGMRTVPEQRRKGLARRVFATLLAEAAQLGASHAYLQVEADNAPALALYGSEGFQPAYAYEYWVR